MPRKQESINAPDFRVALKVKVKSLSDEAIFIRKEEVKARSWYDFIALKQHRRTDVRWEARAAQLAYGFLRHRPYRSMESSTRPGNEPDWKRVRQLVLKYSVPNHILPASQREQVRADALKRFDIWREE